MTRGTIYYLKADNNILVCCFNPLQFLNFQYGPLILVWKYGFGKVTRNICHARFWKEMIKKMNVVDMILR